MRLDQIIGLLWELEVDEVDLRKVIDADEVRVIPNQQAVSTEFQAGRVTVFLDQDNRIAGITHEGRDGSFGRVMGPDTEDEA